MQMHKNKIVNQARFKDERYYYCEDVRLVAG